MLRSIRSCWGAAGCALLALVLGSELLAKPIHLRSGKIDPAMQGRAIGRSDRPRNGAGLYLVQFRAPLDDAARNALNNLGVDLLRYVPEDTYVAHVPVGSVAVLETLPFVEWVGEFSSEHKVHAKVRERLQANQGGNLISVSMLLRPRAPAAEARGAEGAFQVVKQKSVVRFGTILRGTVSSARLAALANSPVVLWIEPGPNFKLVDEVSSKIVAGDGGVNMTLAQSAGFDGRGVTVAVADSGLNNGDAATMHPDLFGRVTAFFYYGNLIDAADEHSHGTHCAGIVAGNGATGEIDEEGALYGLGVAPQARIIAQRIFDGEGNYEPPASFETLTRDAVRAGADVGSNSWGDDTQGRYDLSAAEFDALVRDADELAPGDQSYILEFSAGNAGQAGYGTIGSPAVAKNVIATGASQSSRIQFELYSDGIETMADFSSRGPCEDGRIKPDLVAPGTWIASLQSASAGTENAWDTISPNYMYQGGTSQAGPHVSGAAAVLVQYFRQVYGMARPSPALVKAALINSAVDMDDEVETGPVPNMDEGWGRLEISELVLGARQYEFLDQTVLLGPNQVFEKRVVIASPLEPLKITLVYTDVPAFPGAIPALVNDLDLEVVAPDGAVYRGNQFRDGESIPNPAAADNVNNVEGVHLFEPVGGEYIIRVRARRVTEDARGDTAPVDQDFALVISGDIPVPGVGAILMDRPAYAAPSVINLKLFDRDLSGQATVSVQLRSTTELSPENIVLRAANTTGGFTGAVATVSGSAVIDGRLQIRHGDLIEAIYNDASAGTRSTTARADFVPPVLTQVTATSEFGRTVIEWQSNERADSMVRFGTNAALNFSATDSFFTQDHLIELRGLRAGQTYFFVVISADEAGNLTTNNNGGALFSFVPVAARPVLLVDAYEEDTETTPVPLSGYTNALNQAGVAYELWDVSLRGSPTLQDLRPFQAVIWRISDSPYVSTSLDSQQQTAIQDYLNQGGAFFISSMELLSRLGDVPFRRNVLQVQQFLTNPDPLSTCTDCDEDFMVPTIRGSANDPITAGVLADLDYSAYPILDFGFFIFGPDFSDTFTPTTNAAAILFESDSGKPCAMKFPRTGQDSTGRVVFLSFPIDTVPLTGSAPNNRAALFRNILQFLVPGASGSGMLAFDRAAYTVPDLVTVEVADSDLAGAGQATVEFYTQSFSNHVAVVARETGTPGLFRGSVILGSVTEPVAPGRIRARHGDRIFAEYFDVSIAATVRAAAQVDTQPALVSNLLLEPEYESALASWDTSEPTDALVQYGESVLLGRSAYDPEIGDIHQVRLSDLAPDRLYYYRVVSRDEAGNVIVDDNGGQLYTFRTLAPLHPPFQDNFETGASGWTTFDAEDTESRWTLGTPSNGMETEAHSPVNAWGSNLDGRALDYAESFLISPAIDLSGGNHAILRFFHSFDFTQSDFIEGGQLLIITNTVTAPVTLRDYTDFTFGWEEEEIDLSPYAGRVVFLVWYYGLFSIEAAEVPGWLVDDVSVTINTVVPSVVRVTNNLSQGNFVLNGPGISRSGQGLLNVYSNMPPGQYTIAFGAVQFYQTPANQTLNLAEGSTLVFQGNYAFADVNNNGMSDAWEQQNFGAVSPGRTRTTDTDTDGATDYEEFVAGTSPTIAAEYLKVTAPQIIGPNLRLTWGSVPGRIYRLEGSSNGVTWTPASDWILARAVFTSATLPAQGPLPPMFRVEVRP